jgi:hypothetical protein
VGLTEVALPSCNIVCMISSSREHFRSYPHKYWNFRCLRKFPHQVHEKECSLSGSETFPAPAAMWRGRAGLRYRVKVEITLLLQLAPRVQVELMLYPWANRNWKPIPSGKETQQKGRSSPRGAGSKRPLMNMMIHAEYWYSLSNKIKHSLASKVITYAL